MTIEEIYKKPDIAELLQKAKAGDVKAQVTLAERFEQECMESYMDFDDDDSDLEGLKEDSFYWFAKSAENGNPAALYKIAEAYIDGDNEALFAPPKDVSLGCKLMCEAAEQGDESAWSCYSSYFEDYGDHSKFEEERRYIGATVLRLLLKSNDNAIRDKAAKYIESFPKAGQYALKKVWAEIDLGKVPEVIETDDTKKNKAWFADLKKRVNEAKPHSRRLGVKIPLWITFPAEKGVRRYLDALDILSD